MGCLTPFVKAISDDETAPSRDGIAEAWLLKERLRTSIDELLRDLWVFGPVGDQAPAKVFYAPTLIVYNQRKDLLRRRDVVSGLVLCGQGAPKRASSCASLRVSVNRPHIICYGRGNVRPSSSSILRRTSSGIGALRRSR